MTEKEAIELVRKGGYALQYVPYELRAREMCDKAVGQNGWALKFVPDELRDEVMSAVNGGSLK
jgi:hypothetical protein